MPPAKRAILVTGASSGIGLDAAVALARHGFLVYGGVRRDADAQRIAALHPDIVPVLLDVTDRDAVHAAAALIRERAVPLHGLINNAGIALGGPLEFLPVDEVRRQFEVNVFGALEVTQALLPLLRDARGRIAFIGSVSGELAVPFLGPYCSSKFALRALADCLRGELARWNLFVSLIEAGSVKSPIWQKGSRSRQALLVRLGPSGERYYKEELDALFRMTDREARGAMPVERVTSVILHAMTARRPKAWYAVGVRMARFFSLFPAAMRDRVMIRALRQP